MSEQIENLSSNARKAAQMLDLPGTPDEEWLGFRPTLPDSLPVIGHSDSLHGREHRNTDDANPRPLERTAPPVKRL